ncbi:MAG: hypothetical protein JWM68_393 [Verrucomicrobiales bacterium]|nr:hypothetical protein [Verrucomicrobiales bacterium]
MSEFKYYLKPLSAFEMMKRLAAMIASVSPERLITNVSIYTNVGTVDFLDGKPCLGNQLENNAPFVAALESLAVRPYVELRSATINTKDGYQIAVHGDEDFHIKITTDSSRDTFKQLSPVSDALAKNFNLLRQQEFEESKFPEQESRLLKTTQTILLDFSSQAAHLSQLSAGNTERMSDLLIKKTEELDAAYNKRRLDLDADHKQREEKLGKQEELFSLEKKKFDARENTVVRRDLLSRIEAIIEKQKSIEISDATIKKREPIHRFCQFAMLVAVAMAAVFGYKVFTDSVFDWHHLLPFSTGTILFVSTGIFYIRWNDQWFKDHAHAEFQNRKFYTDILRASWIAELLFEWKEKKEVPFPDTLISSYTSNLFVDTVSDARTPHPFDDLSSAMKDITKLKVGKGSVEIEKPTLRKP